MKVFLSWSGDESKQLAEIFKEWLPNVVQFIEPYMSSKDIESGEKWGSNIETNLENCNFGIVFVTPNNINSPWINFEAGALSKTYKSKVVPVLYDADITILNNGPLIQFQTAQKITKEGIFELLQSIISSSEASNLDIIRLENGLEKWWPDLIEKIDNISSQEQDNKIEKAPSDSEMLKSIVIKLNQQDKELRQLRNVSAHKDLLSESIEKKVNSGIRTTPIHLILPELKKIIDNLSSDPVDEILNDSSIGEEGKFEINSAKKSLISVVTLIERIYKKR